MCVLKARPLSSGHNYTSAVVMTQQYNRPSLSSGSNYTSAVLWSGNNSTIDHYCLVALMIPLPKKANEKLYALLQSATVRQRTIAPETKNSTDYIVGSPAPDSDSLHNIRHTDSVHHIRDSDSVHHIRDSDSLHHICTTVLAANVQSLPPKIDKLIALIQVEKTLMSLLSMRPG